MATTGAPPTALERLRTSMRENQAQTQRFRREEFGKRNAFRESVCDFLVAENLNRAPMTRHELRELTDVQFYASHSFLNFTALSCVLGVTFSLGWMGWGRDIKDDYKSIHDQYQTLLTPIFWTNSMWLVIFASEAVFVIFQLMYVYKNLPIVEITIGYWFFGVCLCQMGWVIAYSFDIIYISVLFMACNIVILCILNLNLYHCEYIDAPKKVGGDNENLEPVPEELKNMNIVMEYVVFRLPFQLHLGWAIFVILVNINEAWAIFNLPAQGVVAIGSLIALWVIGICVLFIPRYPLFVLPLMTSWGAMGICVELINPLKNVIVGYEEVEIKRMQGAAIATCIEHVVLPIVRFAIHFATTYNLAEKEDVTMAAAMGG